MVLEEVPNDPRAIEGLAKLSRDRNEKVRMAVAKSLSKSDNSLSTQTLMAMASSDKSQAVKLLAIESLGHHTGDEVKTFLASQLNDRSPAIQSSATVALRYHTGVDFRGDVAKWKQYMNGDDIKPEAPSLASQFLSIWR
jgi:HEAT repeat protein